MPSKPMSSAERGMRGPDEVAASNTGFTSVTSFTIPADHPALPGHFPGHPIVPGVLILAAVLDALGRIQAARCVGLPQAKFLSPLRPGERCDIRFNGSGAKLDFDCSVGTRTVARGTLRCGDRVA